MGPAPSLLPPLHVQLHRFDLHNSNVKLDRYVENTVLLTILYILEFLNGRILHVYGVKDAFNI